MSPLPQTGVELVAKGFADYIKKIGEASKAITTMGNITQNKLKALNEMSDTVKELSGDYTKLVEAITSYNGAQRRSAADTSTSHRNVQSTYAKTTQTVINDMADQVKAQMNAAREGAKNAGKAADAAEKAAQKKAKAEKKAADDAKKASADSANAAQDQIKAFAAVFDKVAAMLGGTALGGFAAKIGSTLRSLPTLAGSLGKIPPIITNIGKAAGSAAPFLGALGMALVALAGAVKVFQLAKKSFEIGWKIGETLTAPIRGFFSLVTTTGKNAFNTLVSTGKTALDVLGKLGKLTFDVTIAGLRTLGSVVNFLLTPIRWLGEQIRQVIVTALGVLLRDAVRAAIDSLQELMNMLFEGASSMQTITIRLQGMMATELQSRDATLKFSEAMSAAVGSTRRLIDWINVLAVKSPFERGTIADTIALGMALDFTSGEAKTITKALVDWASGMGLEQDAITRILYNFGQMRTQGKLTGQELRDAARGGLIPVMDILRRLGEQAGLTGKELENAMQHPAETFRGSDVDKFFSEFIKMAEERFPNAAERMSRTWVGVQNNIKDFIKTVMGADVLTPVMDRIAGKMADALNLMLAPNVRKQFQAIGQALVYAFDKIWPAFTTLIDNLGRLAEAFGLPKLSAISLAGTIQAVAVRISSWLRKAADTVLGWANKIQQYFSGLGQNALTYGFNTAVAWAQGFMDGATKAIVAAMNALARLLASFLKAFSPPKIVPDIGEWGAHTFEEWLKGFSEADFSVLDSVGNAVKSALDLMVNMGKLGKENAQSIYQGILKGLVGGIAGGGFSADFLAKIKNQLGDFGSAIVDLAKKQWEYGKATEAAAAAEKALADAQRAAAAQRGKVNSLIREYNRSLRAGAGKAELAGRLAIINAEEKTLAVQEEQVKTAETASEDAKQKAEDLKAIADQQQRVVDQLIKIGEAFVVDTTADNLSELGEIASGVSEDMLGLSGSITEVDDVMRKFREADEASMIAGQVYQAQLDMEASIKAIGDKWAEFVRVNFDTTNPDSNASKINKAFAEVNTAATTLKNDLNQRWTDIYWDLNAFYYAHIYPKNSKTEVGMIIAAFESISDTIGDIIKAVQAVSDWFTTNKGIVGAVVSAWVSAVLGPLNPLVSALQRIVDLIKFIQNNPVSSSPSPSPSTHNCNKGYHWDESIKRCVPDNAQSGAFIGTQYPTKVGEHGWEYFVPRVPGYVVPHNISMAIEGAFRGLGNARARAVSSRAVGGPVTIARTVNINFGQVNINSGMDIATLTAIIRQTVVRSL